MKTVICSPPQLWSLLSVFEVRSSTCYRHYHPTPHLMANLRQPTRLERLAKLNKTLSLHRNFPFGPQPMFWRGGKKVDLCQRHSDKLEAHRQWMTYSRQTQVGESPIDDVYLTNLYKAKHYSVGEAVGALKGFTQLDFTDQESPIILSLDLDEVKRKLKGRKKHPLTFFKTLSLPHPHGIKNKVCLFTENETVTEEATSMGVYAVGMSDVITQILNGSLRCGAYFATADSLNELLNLPDLKRSLGGQMPSKRFHVVEKASETHEAINNVIVHNLINTKRCNVIIGRPRQTIGELEANIRHVFDAVHEEATQSRAEKIIRSASLSCFTELLTIDSSDILQDDV